MTEEDTTFMWIFVGMVPPAPPAPQSDDILDHTARTTTPRPEGYSGSYFEEPDLPFKGRRARLVKWRIRNYSLWIPDGLFSPDWTVREMLENPPPALFEDQPISIHVTPARDLELVPAFQDLANEISEDLREACFAFDNPDLWYPGVDDDSIPPVSDDHIATVIPALQRELNRELRASPPYGIGTPRPAAPLAKLPDRIQRAIVERRRLRYQEFGITHEVWERGTWSLSDIPLDPEWIPRRAKRLAGIE